MTFIQQAADEKGLGPNSRGSHRESGSNVDGMIFQSLKPGNLQGLRMTLERRYCVGTLSFTRPIILICQCSSGDIVT